MKVRLTRKLAEFIDDIDLRSYRVGDVFSLPRHEALLLIAEGWAERPLKRFGEPRHSESPHLGGDPDRQEERTELEESLKAEAADRPRRRPRGKRR